MTAILRGPSPAVQALQIARSAAVPPPAAIDPEKLELEEWLRTLEADFARREVQHKKDLEQARIEGEAAGRKDAELRHQALSNGLVAARNDFAERLRALDSLAASLVRTALAKVFHDPDARADNVLSAIRSWLAQQEGSAQISIRLSTVDMAAIGQERLASELGDAVHHVVSDRALAAGDCVVDARWGTIDLAPLRQWNVLEQTFATMLAHDA